MATDIAGSVTAEYTATIPVADDGEPFDHAAEVQALLPLANRIEYVRQYVGADSAPTSIAFTQEIRDVFFSLEQETSFTVDVNGYQFQKSETGANTYDPITELKRPGVTEFGVATGNVNNRVLLQEAFVSLRRGDLEQLFLSIRSPNWALTKIQFGLSATPTDFENGPGFWIEQNGSTFRAKDRNGGVTTAQGVASAAPTNSQNVLIGFRRSGTSLIASFNDTDIATFTPAYSGTMGPALNIACNSTSGAVLQVDRWRRVSDTIAWGIA